MGEITPALTQKIDAFAERELHIPVETLMGRAGDAVAAAVAALTPPPARILLFCGGGNNGGDGYAAACRLTAMGYRALCVDALGAGQRSEAGRRFLAEYRRLSGEPLSLREAAAMPSAVCVDAVLGTGARLPLPPSFAELSEVMRAAAPLHVAVDLPLGVDAEGGAVDALAVPADETVCLGFAKVGLYSYPARAFVGRVTVADLGLDTPAVRAAFGITSHLLTSKTVRPFLPKRVADSHKGSYGHLLLLVGSHAYRGAALLAAKGALRMGAGLITLASDESVLRGALPLLPELILTPLDGEAPLPDAIVRGKSAVLLGSGSGVSEALAARLTALLTSEGGPLVIDADGLTVLAERLGVDALKTSKRKVVLTPHPGEMARLVGTDVPTVQADRLTLARRFAADYGVTLVLKGAGTVVAEGERFYINTSGTPALAKGGSGDVLAGAIASLIATGLPPAEAAALAVWLHGAAGERLAAVHSSLGVRPFELADAMAGVLSEVEA
ncbi:MAG: NAD(P)H-hydrate dehydratase [Clostridia bacterium]|nr:NAD(P)H-hydrate dehydratase [Clostridia bacterium]